MSDRQIIGWPAVPIAELPLDFLSATFCKMRFGIDPVFPCSTFSFDRQHCLHAFSFRRCDQTNQRTTSLPSTAGTQFSLPKCIETHEITYPYNISPKKVKYSTKSATRTFRAYGNKFRRGFGGKYVSRFSSYLNTQLVQERRVRLLECAHEGCYPKACVGGEKIAKDISRRNTASLPYTAVIQFSLLKCIETH